MMGVVWDTLRELRHPYYPVNILLCLSYLICKLIRPICDIVLAGQCHFESQETEILFFTLIVVMVKARKTGSMTAVSYLSNSFVYCKVSNAILWFLLYRPYGLVFIAVFVVQALLLPQPTYKGPQKIMYFRDGKTFKEEIAKDKKMTWLVEFYTAWNPSCVNFAPVFAELSHTYALDNFKFGKIDLGRHPEIGKEFGISDSAFSKQLPTVILFQEGKIVTYRPFVDASSKLIKFHFKKENVIQTFDLNNIHVECMKAIEERKKNKKLTSPADSHLKNE